MKKYRIVGKTCHTAEFNYYFYREGAANSGMSYTGETGLDRLEMIGSSEFCKEQVDYYLEKEIAWDKENGVRSWSYKVVEI